MGEPPPSHCPACGGEFACGAGSDRCWCMEVSVDREALRSLAAADDGCLCPDCLRSVAAREARTQ